MVVGKRMIVAVENVKKQNWTGGRKNSGSGVG